uniref:Uncharacterized protein n=1 Tax=Sinocyclocheilus rhinocerous TaxID=307959 RepID=A0A673JVV3_9TELE
LFSKEISRVKIKRVVVAHQAEKGYKTISKEFGLHKSTTTLTEADTESKDSLTFAPHRYVTMDPFSQ